MTVSLDGGATFKVIKTMIGSCPPAGGKGDYSFTIPDFAPSKSRAVFAWSWINHSGNREFYMDCSFVDIQGSAPSASKWAALPNIFVAQLSGINSCRIPEGTDVVPARAGLDVQYGNGMSSASPKWGQNCEWSASGSGAATAQAAIDSMEAMPAPAAPMPQSKPSPAIAPPAIPPAMPAPPTATSRFAALAGSSDVATV